ncbi:MAG: exosortase/archaeosortase family protein [Gammaproteobacteria bacterium]|nr:exosortase/archaeosortase family protein [Gammaproteobacteria bacterium]
MNIRMPALGLHILFLATLALVLLMYSAGIEFLMLKWLNFDHGTYNHGFLLLAVAIYFFYKRFPAQKFSDERFKVVGAVCSVLLALIGFALGAINIVAGQVLVLYLLLFFMLLATYGWGGAKASIFPLAILSFAIPVWDVIDGVLQQTTALMSYYLVQLSGIHILKQGIDLVVPAGRFEVAPSCSGISYFLAAAPLAIIYAARNFGSKKHQTIVVASIVLAAIVSNWIRVAIIVVVGETTNMQHSLVEDHFNLGWVIFGVFFIGAILIFNRVFPGPGDEAQINTETPISSKVAASHATLLSAGILIIFLANLTITQKLNNVSSASALEGISVPREFTLTQPISLARKIDVPGDVNVDYLAVSMDSPVYLRISGFERQTQGWEIVSSLTKPENYFETPGGWVEYAGKRNLSSLVVNKYFLHINGMKRYVVWQWYFVNGHHTGVSVEAKLAEFAGYVRGNNAGAVIFLMVETGMEDSLIQFAQELTANER